MNVQHLIAKRIFGKSVSIIISVTEVDSYDSYIADTFLDCIIGTMPIHDYPCVHRAISPVLVK